MEADLDRLLARNPKGLIESGIQIQVKPEDLYITCDYHSPEATLEMVGMQLEYDPANWAAKEYYYRTHYAPKIQPASTNNDRSSASYIPSLTDSSSDSYVGLRPYTPSLSGGHFLDALTLDSEPRAGQDPIEGFLAGKQALLAGEIRDIAGLIYEREAIKEANHQEIDQEYCGVKTNLFQIDRITMGVNPQVDRIRVGLEQQLRMLDSDKRREEVECWRDVTRLKGELRETLREFGQEQRKTELLSSAPYTPWK
jgi:hypothetical protein